MVTSLSRPRIQPPKPGELLFSGNDWDFETIRRIHDACEAVAGPELGLSWYPNQIEIITAEQMLDAYASIGMPLFYKHWSFGKHFAQHEAGYRRGLMGLAYEIVINSDPCISYVMEENTATMQTLVIAHAAFGHNHFFKNNYLFKQWTDAEGILDYLDFAKGFIARCEERHGHQAVEQVLDAAHALMSQGVHRYPRKKRPDLASEQRRERERVEHGEQIYNDLWRTLPAKPGAARTDAAAERRRALLGTAPGEHPLLPGEGGPAAPSLAARDPAHRAPRGAVLLPAAPDQGDERGLRHLRPLPHHERALAAGQIGEAAYLEFLQSHTNVIRQPTYDDRSYGGHNPYAIGFAMMQDIQRIVEQPTTEDRDWFPEIAGTGDAMAVLRDVWENYRDESFIAQFLSPKLMRDLRLFHVVDDPDEPELRVAAIHDERGYRKMRRSFARQYDVAWLDPDIEVVDVDLEGDRRLILHHKALNRITLQKEDANRVLQHLADLWGYDVVLKEIDPASGTVLAEHHASARPIFF